MPASIHAFPEAIWEAPWRLEKVAGDFPNVRIVPLSALSVSSCVEPVIRIAERHSNIMLDTLLFPVNQIVERCMERLGPERFLFGSDLIALPVSKSYHSATSLKGIRRSPTLTQHEKTLIPAENARQLFAISA